MSEAVVWPELSPQTEEVSSEQTAEVIPAEVLEDTRLSHQIVWYTGELGISAERIDPSTTHYEGPPNSLLIRFATEKDKETFLEGVMDEFEFSEERPVTLGLFPVEEKGVWQVMIYECDPQLNEDFLGNRDKFYDANRFCKEDFLNFLSRKAESGWRPEL